MRTRGDKFEGRLAVGSRVHSILYGGRDGTIFAINGEQRPESIRHLGGGVVCTGGYASMDVVFDKGTISRGIPESILRGVQWYILDGQADQQEINNAIQYAEQEEEREKTIQQMIATSRARGRELLRKENPEFEQVDPQKYDTLQKGSRNLKKELRRTFPETNFSVRSESYSGGCSININWADGPTTDQVEAISAKYQEGHFNGMEDIYESNQDNLWPDVFGGAKYVFPNRHYSKKAFLRAVAETEKDCNAKITVSYTSSDSPYISRENDTQFSDYPMDFASLLINQKLSETDYRKES